MTVGSVDRLIQDLLIWPGNRGTEQRKREMLSLLNAAYVLLLIKYRLNLDSLLMFGEIQQKDHLANMTFSLLFVVSPCCLYLQFPLIIQSFALLQPLLPAPGLFLFEREFFLLTISKLLPIRARHSFMVPLLIL